MKKTTRNIIIIVAAVVAAIGIVLAIVLPITLRHADELFTVTFESNGGSAVDSITDVEYGSLITEPTAPTKTGYSFAGWFKDERLNKQWKFASDKVKSNITLYAKWTYEETNGLQMMLNGSSYTVAGIGNATNISALSIPETYKGLPVTTIAKEAFDGQSSIETLFIPSSVKTIFNAAFRNCDNLVEVVIAGQSTTLGEGVFRGCAKLQKVTLPTELTTIEKELFYDCKKLSEINFPSTLVTLGNHAFSGCASLVEVHLPASIRTIGENVFSGCVAIESLKIETNNFFYSSDNGENLNCIVAITMPNGETVNKLIVGCKNTRIPSNSSRPITVIGQGAFYGCSTLTSINIPYGVTEIENEAFSGCQGLERIVIPASVTRVGDYAFSSCEALTSVTFTSPEEGSESVGIQVLGQEAFSYCYSLSPGFHLPSSLKEVGAGLLYGCDFERLTITYGDDVSKLQTLIVDGQDGNDKYTTLVRVSGENGSEMLVSNLA